MGLVSNFQPVSSHYNLILPSDFFFNRDFMSFLPQSLSIPLFCACALWRLHTLSSAGSHPTPRAPLGTQWSWQNCEHCQDTSWCPRASGRCNVTRWLCVCSKGGWQRAEPRVELGCRDSQRQQQGGEGVLPMLLGVYPCPEQDCMSWRAGPKNFAGAAFLHSGIVCLPKRSGKDLWGRTEKGEEIPHKNRTLGSQNNISSLVILGDNQRAV